MTLVIYCVHMVRKTLRVLLPSPGTVYYFTVNDLITINPWQRDQNLIFVSPQPDDCPNF